MLSDWGTFGSVGEAGSTGRQRPSSHAELARSQNRACHRPPATDHAAPLGAPQWTKVVQAVLKRQAGVPFAPKDLRASFITFLMSDENSDEVVKKAVAHAMRHSTAQLASPAYDKERVERTWAAAVQVAGSYAARFK